MKEKKSIKVSIGQIFRSSCLALNGIQPLIRANLQFTGLIKNKFF